MDASAAFDGPGGFDLRFNSGSTSPQEVTAFAGYAEDSDEGFREGSTTVYAGAYYGYLLNTYNFSASNARYTCHNGSANLSATDDLFLSNADGVTGGKYRVRLRLTREGSANGSASIFSNGFGGAAISSTPTLVSDEMDFLYDQAISANLSLSTQAEQFFSSFETFSSSVGFSAEISFILTDTGGADFLGITQTSASGNTYGVEVVPEPASMAALELGALALTRRRKRA